MAQFCIEVAGDYACFTRPEMKVERVSYDFINPSAARAVFEAILWKPAIRWQVRKIEVLKPVNWISVRRNEVGSVVSTRKVQAAMNAGRGYLGLNIEEDRQQRAGLFLRDVGYRLHAEMELVSDEARSNPGKYAEMFTRRAQKGQCVNQPYLGCREFDARVQLIQTISTENMAEASVDGDYGWMLYDMDFTKKADPRPQFFRARAENGVIELAHVEVRG
jgi:CRISPR-associated protein Cas5d